MDRDDRKPSSSAPVELELGGGEDLWQPPQGVGIDESGKVDKLPSAQPRVDPELELARQPRATQSSPPEELELARDIRRDEPGGLIEPQQRRSVLGPILALMVVALVIAAGWFAWPHVRRPVERALPHSATPMLKISSTPEGAEVLAAGQPIGQTPLVIDNVYPDRPIPLEIRLSGYQPWRGKFQGAADAAVDARLVRRGGSKGR